MAAPDVKQQQYNAEQIQVLEGLEPVRKRPGMYIGTTGPRGLHHLVYEVVDNSIDEAIAGFCKNIDVTIKADNSIMVEDDGRGMPVDLHPKLKIPAVEVIHTVLHAGGKFGGGGYKVSGGLHGVGASVVNALSEIMEVEIKRNGNIYRQVYSRGKAVTPLEIVGEAGKKTGSRTVFKPDSEIFDEIEFSYDTLEHRLREMAFLNKGIKIQLKDEREGQKKKELFHYEGGIKEFVKYMNKNKEVIHPDVIYFDLSKKDMEVEVRCSIPTVQRADPFLPTISTPRRGAPIVIGFKAALTRVFNDYAKRANISKTATKAYGGRRGGRRLTAIVSVSFCLSI